jgi:HEAT repeat protein
MTLLLLALLLVGGLAAANFLSAAAIRLRLAWKARHWAPVRARLSADVAMYCVEALDELPPTPRRRDRRLLRDVMLETAPEVSGGALERLRAAFAERGFLEEARRGMRARSFLARVRAAEALGALGGDDARDALLLGLEDDAALVRIASAHALVRTGATDVLRPIVTALAGPDDEAARGALAEALLDAGPAAVDELLAVLHDGALAPRVRWLVVVVLGELRAIAAVEDLLACLGSPDDELRARAAHALGKIGDPRAVPPLEAIARDGEPWQVRTAASAALGGLGDPAAVDGLVHALAADEWAVRDAAARSLVELGEPAVEAVAARAGALPPSAVAHLWGRLDVAWRTDAVLDRAAEGDALAAALVRAAAAGGATARMEERARAEDRAGRWARDELTAEAGR